MVQQEITGDDMQARRWRGLFFASLIGACGLRRCVFAWPIASTRFKVTGRT